jgi:hypothetical protein
MAGMFRPSSNSREIYFFHFPHNGGLRGVTYGTKNLVKSMIFDDFDTGENAKNVGSRGLCFPPTSHGHSISQPYRTIECTHRSFWPTIFVAIGLGKTCEATQPWFSYSIWLILLFGKFVSIQ